MSGSASTIALGPWGRGEAGWGNALGGTGNIIDMMSSMMKFRQLQQEFQARTEYGNIVTTSPNLETAQERWRQSPYFGWAPNLGTELRQQQLIDTQVANQKAALQGALVGNFKTGMEAMMGAVRMSPNPEDLDRNLATAMNALPPQIQQQVLPYTSSIRTSLLDGLDKLSPDERKQAYAQRWPNIVIGSGMEPSHAYAVQGTIPPTLLPGGPFGPGGAQVPTGGIIGGAAAPSLPMGLTPEAQKQQEKTGEIGGQIQEEMTTAAKNLPTQLNKLDVLAGALQGFQAGGGAAARAELAQSLQAVRNAGATFISPDLIDAVGNQSLSDTQLFQANIRPFVTGLLREAAEGTGAGRIRSEVEAFLKMAHASTDPRALIRILNQAKYNLQVESDRAQYWPTFKNLVQTGDPSVRGLGLADYYSWWNVNRATRMAPTGGPGLITEPYPTSLPKGTPPAAESFDSVEAVQKAYRDKKLSRSDAERILKQRGWIQ